MQVALDDEERPNKLVTIKGGGHGLFSAEETHRFYTEIEQYLHGRDLWPERVPDGEI